jgi:hypothetical protein
VKAVAATAAPAFTPGPWLMRVDGTCSGRWLEIYVEDEAYYEGVGLILAQSSTVESKPDGKKWVRTRDASVIKANFRLFMAAPEMYAALRKMIADEGFDDLRQSIGETPSWLTMARAALLKAEGGAR